MFVAILFHGNVVFTELILGDIRMYGCCVKKLGSQPCFSYDGCVCLYHSHCMESNTSPKRVLRRDNQAVYISYIWILTDYEFGLQSISAKSLYISFVTVPPEVNRFTRNSPAGRLDQKTKSHAAKHGPILLLSPPQGLRMEPSHYPPPEVVSFRNQCPVSFNPFQVVALMFCM